MELFKIIIVIVIIFLLYKICTYKENIIEGHLGYTLPTESGTGTLPHTQVTCLNDDGTELGTEDCEWATRINDPDDSIKKMAEILLNFHPGDQVLAIFKPQPLDPNGGLLTSQTPDGVETTLFNLAQNFDQNIADSQFLDIICGANELIGTNRTIDTCNGGWSGTDALLVGKVIGIHKQSNLVLVEFYLPNNINTSLGTEGVPHIERQWVTPGAPGFPRQVDDQVDDQWINHHKTLFPDDAEDLPNNWYQQLAGYAYTIGGAAISDNNDVKLIYGGVIHWNNSTENNLNLQDVDGINIIKNNNGVPGTDPGQNKNCTVIQGGTGNHLNPETTARSGEDGRCKLYINQLPGAHGSQTCSSAETKWQSLPENPHNTIEVGQKYTTDCDTCSKPDLTTADLADNFGPLEFINSQGNVPEKIRRNDICNTIVPINESDCPSECIFTPGDGDTGATCSLPYSWDNNDPTHPFAVKCAQDYENNGGFNINQCEGPEDGSNLYEKEGDGGRVGVTPVEGGGPCVRIPTCRSPLDIHSDQTLGDSDDAVALNNIYNNSQKYTINEGEIAGDRSYLRFKENPNDFEVTATCAPGYLNPNNPDNMELAEVSQCVTESEGTDNDIANKYYNLSGCTEQSPCFHPTGPGGRNTSENDNNVCIFNKSGCDALKEAADGMSTDEIFNNPTCTITLPKARGSWDDINDGDEYSCSETCDINNNILSKKKLKIWRIINPIEAQSSLITATDFMDGPQSYTVESTSDEDNIMILRKDENDITHRVYINKGDVLKEGDIRIGYYNKKLTKTVLENQKVYGAFEGPLDGDDSYKLRVGNYVKIITGAGERIYTYRQRLAESIGKIGIITSSVEGNTAQVRLNGESSPQPFDTRDLEEMKQWHYLDCDRAGSERCSTTDCQTNHYPVCSKHCDSSWMAHSLSSEDFLNINTNSTIYDFNEKNDLSWGPCNRQDGTDCGEGLQAVSANIMNDKSNGGECFFPGGKKCLSRDGTNTEECMVFEDESGCNGNTTCKWANEILNENSPNKILYRRCRGSMGDEWTDCDSTLTAGIQTFTTIKNNLFALEATMITPIRMGSDNLPDTRWEGEEPPDAPNCNVTPSEIAASGGQCPVGCIRIPPTTGTVESCILIPGCQRAKYKARDNFWEGGQVWNAIMTGSGTALGETELSKQGIIDQINKLITLQLNYVQHDKRILPNGRTQQGLETKQLLQRVETNIPHEIYGMLLEGDATRALQVITSIPIGGSIPSIEWYRLFCIRIIYLLELINLITIESIDYIKTKLRYDTTGRSCENFPLVNYEYINKHYTGDNSGNEPTNIRRLKESWNIYPWQWIYGSQTSSGNIRSGLSSDNISDVTFFMNQLIRTFYYPCASISLSELEPMEQYIRFNVDLYKHIQTNKALISTCESQKDQEYKLFRDNNKHCDINLKGCGNNDNEYPTWFQNLMDECNNDINKCYINQDGSETIPPSLTEKINLWKCKTGAGLDNDTPSSGTCCNLLNLPCSQGTGDCSPSDTCNRDVSNKDDLTSDIITSGTSKIFSDGGKSLKINNSTEGINNEVINATTQRLSQMNVQCNAKSGNVCTSSPYCKLEGDDCIFDAGGTGNNMLEDRFRLGSSKLKKDYNISGKLWDKWLYYLNTGTISSDNVIEETEHPEWTSSNNKWIQGSDWRPGEEPVIPVMGEAQTESSNPDWEENVVIQGDSETIHEYGIQKRNDGQNEFYKQQYCNLWGDSPDVVICDNINNLTNEINTLEESITDKIYEITEKTSTKNQLLLQSSDLNSQISTKESEKNLLLGDVESLRQRPEECTPCKPCINCKECPSVDQYSAAKGVCPACACSQEITDINTILRSRCDANLNERRTTLERRNINTLDTIKGQYDEKIKALDDIIIKSDDEIELIATRDSVCQKERGMFNAAQDVNSSEYLRLIQENEGLLKEYTNEKNKSWFEKLFF